MNENICKIDTERDNIPNIQNSYIIEEKRENVTGKKSNDMNRQVTRIHIKITFAHMKRCLNNSS